MNTDFLEETHEDETGQKLAGLTGETFGNWLCIQYLFVSEQLRGQRIGSKLSFQMPTFYKNHGYREVFTLEEYPYTGKRHSVSDTWKGCIQHGCIYYAAAVCIDPGSIYSG